MWDCNSNRQSGSDELKPLVSLPNIQTQGTADFPWPLPASPVLAPEPSAVLLQCLDAHRHVHSNSCTCAYTYLPLPSCPCSRQVISQTFKPVPTWGPAATTAWLLWSMPWALGTPEKSLGCEWGMRGYKCFLRCFATLEVVRVTVSFRFSWGAITLTMAILCWYQQLSKNRTWLC